MVAIVTHLYIGYIVDAWVYISMAFYVFSTTWRILGIIQTIFLCEVDTLYTCISHVNYM